MSDLAERSLTITRCYRAPRALVWQVWTDPEHLAAWWGPFGPEKTTARLDLVIGGLFEVVMHAPDGSAHPSRGVIRELVPGQRLVIEGDAEAPDACGAGLPPRAMVTVLFEDDAEGTRVTLDAVFVSGEARRAAHASGYEDSWRETLEALDGYLQRIPATQEQQQ
ncbi:SRPBCC family protein [Pelagibius sp.]|uniref:SRPBCC family protein n=1 Tax=Pelagibius sp. TaxID=1931238 RepID=UPI003B50DEF9